MIKTVPGTPEQNGVAERMNRTLNERARCMRIQSGLPKMFWADAINTAAYLINRGPSVPLDYQLPEGVVLLKFRIIVNYWSELTIKVMASLN